MSAGTPPDAARDRILILLSMAAGCVDAASFVGLGQVLTAAMTGNTVLLGLALGHADLDAALRSAVALLTFFTGALLGAFMVGRASALWSGAVMAALLLELALLAGLAIAWQQLGEPHRAAERLALITAAGLAMGLQSAVAGRAGVAGVTTTYVTGTLVALATRLAGVLDRDPSRGSSGEQTRPLWIPTAVWVAYGLGAVLAGAVHRWWPPAAQALGTDLRWSSVALAAPLAIVASAVLLLAGRWRRTT